MRDYPDLGSASDCHALWEIWFNQPKALLRDHLVGKPVVAPPNVDCFLRLPRNEMKTNCKPSDNNNINLHIPWDSFFKKGTLQFQK